MTTRAVHDSPTPRRTAAIHSRRVPAINGVILSAVGQITATDAVALSRALHSELDADPAVMVVDLAGVTACDSTGIEVLAMASHRARAHDVELHLLDRGEPYAQRLLTHPALR